uniref:Uncharacterized protein n=1 Tax=Octopus bimaculoides TaxID=37653 RepID=A0A0L8HP55_OCTBM
MKNRLFVQKPQILFIKSTHGHIARFEMMNERNFTTISAENNPDTKETKSLK